jgi:hypothetical protein
VHDATRSLLGRALSLTICHSSTVVCENAAQEEEEMPNSFAPDSSTGYQIVGILVVLALLVVVGYALWPTGASVCPPTLHRANDGSLELSSGETFPDMNAFQKWWHANREYANCPLPVLTGAREYPIMREEGDDEQTYAKTPIYKVDDYEFSRIFGYERNGRMEVPRQNLNVILNKRAFDWPDKPLSSDERRAKYQGMNEGFTTQGDLKSVVLAEPTAEELVLEATQKYGSMSGRRRRHGDDEEVQNDLECKMSREAREVASMVSAAYASDPNYEPVVTRVGKHHWEVNELKPRRRATDRYVEPEPDAVVDTGNDAVDVGFEYREKQVVDEAIDPYFTMTGDLPYYSQREGDTSDAWYGPVPGMERMFGPTFDHKNWY